MKSEQEPVPRFGLEDAAKLIIAKAATQYGNLSVRQVQEVVQEIRALAAQPPQELVSLREALKWALENVTEPMYRTSANAPYCEKYDKARAALTRGARPDVGDFLTNPAAEAGLRNALSKPAEVWYPCGAKASPGSPLKDCPLHGQECFLRGKGV